MDIELCRKFFASRRNYTVFAGFSGGADSTAALLTALYFAGEFNFKYKCPRTWGATGVTPSPTWRPENQKAASFSPRVQRPKSQGSKV